MMGADHGAVDHLKGIGYQPALTQGLHDLLPEPCQGPAPELTIDAGPFSKLFRQVMPGRPRARDPENPIRNKAMIQGLAPVRCADCQDDAFVKRPLVVRHKVSCQAGLHRRYQLESRSARNVNPFCLHNLEQPWRYADKRNYLVLENHAGRRQLSGKQDPSAAPRHLPSEPRIAGWPCYCRLICNTSHYRPLVE